MINAKDEFLEHIERVHSFVKCAFLHYKDINYILKVDHMERDYDIFLKSIDFEYDNGFG